MNRIKNFVLLAILIVGLLSITLTSCKKNEIEEEENNPVTIEVTLQNVNTPQDIVIRFDEYRAELAVETGKEAHSDDKVIVTVPSDFSFPYTVDVSAYSNINYTNIEIVGNIFSFTIPADEEFADADALNNIVGLFPENGETVTITGPVNFDCTDGNSPDIDFSNIDLSEQAVHLTLGDKEVASTTELADIANYSPTDVDGQVNVTMTGSVTVTFELSAAEENLFINSGVTITTTETLTNMLFNDNANPVTDEIIEYYGNYFTEDNKPYVLSVPENQTLMGDISRNELHTNTEPTEGEKYFKEGNYNTTYNPDASYTARSIMIANIRQDTSYFDNTLTPDSTSYKDINDDYITNLIMGRE